MVLAHCCEIDHRRTDLPQCRVMPQVSMDVVGMRSQPTITCMETQGSTLFPTRDPGYSTSAVGSGAFFFLGSVDIPSTSVAGG